MPTGKRRGHKGITGLSFKIRQYRPTPCRRLYQELNTHMAVSAAIKKRAPLPQDWYLFCGEGHGWILWM